MDELTGLFCSCTVANSKAAAHFSYFSTNKLQVPRTPSFNIPYLKLSGAILTHAFAQPITKIIHLLDWRQTRTKTCIQSNYITPQSSLSLPTNAHEVGQGTDFKTYYSCRIPRTKLKIFFRRVHTGLPFASKSDSQSRPKCLSLL